jgi:hypothetical protein
MTPPARGCDEFGSGGYRGGAPQPQFSRFNGFVQSKNMTCRFALFCLCRPTVAAISQ